MGKRWNSETGKETSLKMILKRLWPETNERNKNQFRILSGALLESEGHSPTLTLFIFYFSNRIDETSKLRRNRGLFGN